VQFNNLGLGLITDILHKKSKCGIDNYLILFSAGTILLSRDQGLDI